MQEIIFLGNGPLAEATLKTLTPHFHILFHAKTPADLATVKELKLKTPELPAILASFGVLIKPDLLELFEPTGILNLHPSRLPDLRGPSPIETAILRGDTDFTISIMKLVKAMDAGPLYHQATLHFTPDTPKSEIYHALATAGATWLVQNLAHLPTPIPQDEKMATFCRLLTTAQSPLRPDQHTATELYNQIRAFQTFPKSKITLFGQNCTVLVARPVPTLPPNAITITTPDQSPTLPDNTVNSSNEAAPTTSPTTTTPPITLSHTKKSLLLHCAHSTYLELLELQPAGKKPMPTPAFLNGYAPR